MMNDFLHDETGAVTVDWVVLTAALVGLGLAVVTVVRTGVGTQSQAIDDQLESDSIIRTAFTGNEAGAFISACSAAGVSSCDDTADLQSISTADLDQRIQAYDDAGFTTASAAATTNTDNGFVQNDAGAWGNYGTPGDTSSEFTQDDAATYSYNQAVADDAYGSLLTAERNARQ